MNRHRDTIPSLSKPQVKAALSQLQEELVFVPTDKASNNISMVCKKFYYEVLQRELGLENPNNTGPYKVIDCAQLAAIIDKQLRYVHGGHFIPDDAPRELPVMYWTPKMHKSPYGHRFIVKSDNCPTTDLSKRLTNALALISRTCRVHSDKIRLFTGTQRCWYIKSTKQVIDRLVELNETHGAQSVQTFDFKTMYTTIPHKQLKRQLGDLIETTFHGCDCKYIVEVSCARKTRWSKQRDPHGNDFTAALKRDLDFLIDNIYFVVGPHVLRQTTGIPMGTNCAPLVADLFLYTFESKFVRRLTTQDIRLARTAANNSRYIDDLLVINNPALERQVNDIYPAAMHIERENVSDQHCEFLDLSISIEGGWFHWKLYDKRDSFDFPINNYPWADSNISRRTGRSVYAGQLIRFVRNSTELEDFHARHAALLQKLQTQGWHADELRRQARKIWRKYRQATDHLTNSWLEFSRAFRQ